MKIKDEFPAPFGEVPELRLSKVKRWSIIDMDKEQSVAEHSFNVAVIVSFLARSVGATDEEEEQYVSDALWHDFDEVYTGDIPSPGKCKKPIDNRIYPDSMVKMADLLESYAFCDNHCCDTPEVKRWVLYGLKQEITICAGRLGIEYHIFSDFMEGKSHV